MSILTMPEEKLYTVKEVADYLRVSRKTVWKMIAQDRLEAFQVGNEYRISQSALDALRKKSKKETDRSE